jgi:hypothetical protein
LFEKKTLLARHRLVNTALKTEVAAIHAWTPKCYTPEQWEKQKQEGNLAVAPGKDTTGEIVTGTKDWGLGKRLDEHTQASQPMASGAEGTYGRRNTLINGCTDV